MLCTWSGTDRCTLWRFALGTTLHVLAYHRRHQHSSPDMLEVFTGNAKNIMMLLNTFHTSHDFEGLLPAAVEAVAKLYLSVKQNSGKVYGCVHNTPCPTLPRCIAHTAIHLARILLGRQTELGISLNCSWGQPLKAACNRLQNDVQRRSWWPAMTLQLLGARPDSSR